MKKAGFNEDGSRYVVRDVGVEWTVDSDLCNDRMSLQIDHRGRVRSAGFIQPNMTPYAGKLRCFYLRDDLTGEFWSVPHDPVRKHPAGFECSIGTSDISWRVESNGVKVDLRLVVPSDDTVELWSVRVTDTARGSRKLSLYPFFPVGRLGLLAHQARYDESLNASVHSYFKYYVTVEEYHELKGLANMVFLASNVRPRGWETSLAEFVGDGGLRAPDQLSRARLRSSAHPSETASEETAAILQYSFSLGAEGCREFDFLFGPARDGAEIRRLKRKYFRRGAFEKALRKAEKFFEKYRPAVTIETPDRDFDAFINNWQSRRSLILARTIRHNMAPQGRNVIQDAMGGAYVDPESSRKWFARIWSHQHTNGWLPHGMPFAEGMKQIPINSIPHKDINSWGPGAVRFYISETGDFTLLDEKVPFADNPKKNASLYDHVCLGLDWLLKDRTPRGLSRIGQGDWCDPLNMAGLKEKGESVWLSEALAMALDDWAAVAARVGDSKRATMYAKEAGVVRKAINKHAWDGRWYARGFTDEGEAFGVGKCREGKIFLNAQSWAIMCGAASGKRLDSCIRSVEKMLMTPAGPMTLAPAYTRTDERIGKLTQKTPGWNENGSVYSHAATFYAYALYVARKSDPAFRVLRSLLPGGFSNTEKRANQAPLFVPNFYRGLPCGKNAGLSSHAPATGTAAWYYRAAITLLMGVRAELDGLRIDPQLPSNWKKALVRRKWRGAEYEIRIKRAARVESTTVILDGNQLEENLLPVPKPRTSHKVEVRLPR